MKRRAHLLRSFHLLITGVFYHVAKITAATFVTGHERIQYLIYSGLVNNIAHP